MWDKSDIKINLSGDVGDPAQGVELRKKVAMDV